MPEIKSPRYKPEAKDTTRFIGKHIIKYDFVIGLDVL
jgi:hypothetical protein